MVGIDLTGVGYEYGKNDVQVLTALKEFADGPRQSSDVQLYLEQFPGMRVMLSLERALVSHDQIIVESSSADSLKIPVELVTSAILSILKSSAPHAVELWNPPHRDSLLLALAKASELHYDPSIRAFCVRALASSPRAFSIVNSMNAEEESSVSTAWTAVTHALTDKETQVASQAVQLLQREAQSYPLEFTSFDRLRIVLLEYLGRLENTDPHDSTIVLRVLDIFMALLSAWRQQNLGATSARDHEIIELISARVETCVLAGVQHRDILVRLSFLEVLSNWWPNDQSGTQPNAPWTYSVSNSGISNNTSQLIGVLLACLNAATDEMTGSDTLAAGIARVVARTPVRSEHSKLDELCELVSHLSLLLGDSRTLSLKLNANIAIASLCAQRSDLLDVWLHSSRFQESRKSFFLGLTARNELREQCIESLAHIMESNSVNEETSAELFSMVDTRRDSIRATEHFVSLMGTPFERTQLAVMRVFVGSSRFQWSAQIFSMTPGWINACVADAPNSISYAVYMSKIALANRLLRTYSSDDLLEWFGEALRRRILETAALANRDNAYSRPEPQVDIATT
uniref:Uncharacterized protein n=1 Tax=Timspurckia oligopyrenoides TaxID=708627 RepID=A0A7S0ZFI4_9RHOD|mmetsp:Transcript_3336/g.5846  ORF Transcript_3336/g.5846 Transcript_3336/m.5846 type:complete len:572 (+) Transcript_3336:30-1745(+)